MSLVCGWMLCSSLVCFNTLISLCFTVVHRKPMLRYYVLKCHIYIYTVQCRQVQSGSTCTFHGTSTCSRTLSTADNSAIGGRSVQKTCHRPSFFLQPHSVGSCVSGLCIDSRCSLPNRQHVWCAAAELLESVGLLHMVPAF